MDNIFQKLYHYTQNDSVKSFIQPKSKLTHILWSLKFAKLLAILLVIID